MTHASLLRAGAGAGGPAGDNAAAVRAAALQLRRWRPDDPRHLPRAPAGPDELLPGTRSLQKPASTAYVICLPVFLQCRFARFVQ